MADLTLGKKKSEQDFPFFFLFTLEFFVIEIVLIYDIGSHFLAREFKVNS